MPFGQHADIKPDTCRLCRQIINLALRFFCISDMYLISINVSYIWASHRGGTICEVFQWGTIDELFAMILQCFLCKNNREKVCSGYAENDKYLVAVGLIPMRSQCFQFFNFCHCFRKHRFGAGEGGGVCEAFLNFPRKGRFGRA